MNVSIPQSYGNWAFVGCSRRLGSVTKRGPISGKNWVIPMTGTWIDWEDADVLTQMEEEVWCFRSNSYIKINPIFYLRPTADDVERRPKNG